MKHLLNSKLTLHKWVVSSELVIYCVIICWPTRLCRGKACLKITSHKRGLSLKIGLCNELRDLCHEYEGLEYKGS